MFLPSSAHSSPSPGIQKENHKVESDPGQESDHAFESGCTGPGGQRASEDRE